MATHILMVTDADGTFQPQGYRFSLTELVTALEQGGFEVTKAHRYDANSQYSVGADITSFKFDNSSHFNREQVDEVWLMGFASSNPDGPYGDPAGFALSNAEVQILGKFMNGGGGVFATGDHDDLGKDLCGKVPRVRSMRKWEADYAWREAFNDEELDTFVPDSEKSPPPIGKYRLDTLLTGHNVHYEFQDQSDDIPQEIDPVMTVVRSHVSHVAGGNVGWKELMPHALLCGPNGVIDVLPDHMHEGRCQVPEDLTETFTLEGNQTDEYPLRSDNVRISPEVVAWGTVKNRTHDPNFDDPEGQMKDSNTDVVSDHFPVIVAYNGHKAKVGRVVVDSTFHHFTNINVTGVKPEFSGENDPTDAVKEQGFLASPEGVEEYDKIKAYWRNIASWLARPHRIKAVAWHVFRDVALDPRLKQTRPRGTAENAHSKFLLRYGASAWNLMTELSSPCKVMSWIFDVAIPDPLSMLLSPSVYVKLTLPDPPPEEIRVRQNLQVDKMELAAYALGAAMLELQQPQHREFLQRKNADVETGMRLVERGALTGLRRGLSDQAARMDRTLGALKAAMDIGAKIDPMMQLRKQPSAVAAQSPEMNVPSPSGRPSPTKQT